MATSIPTDGFTHQHVFLGRDHDANARRTLWVVLLTAVTMVAEIAAGILFGSMALLADGLHMATHAGALGVAAGAYAFARRHARDPRYTFGTGKIGDLAGFASALVLGVVALGIALESVQRLIVPGPVAFGPATLVAALGLLVNLASAWLLAGGHAHARHHHGHEHHGHEHHGHEHHGHHHHGHTSGQDNNLRAAYAHVVADALTSVLAIAALLAGRYLGLVWLDPAIGVVGAVIIARWSWLLMRDASAVLLDVADPRLAARIRRLVEQPGDVAITDLHVWRVGPSAHAAIVSVVAASGIDGEAVRARLGPVHELAHLTVECRQPV